MVSIAYAIKFGLDIEYMDEDHELFRRSKIDFGGGEVGRIVGEVTLQWRGAGQLSKTPFSVHCYVFEHGSRDVVFGVPFIGKRDHYKEKARQRAGGGSERVDT